MDVIALQIMHGNQIPMRCKPSKWKMHQHKYQTWMHPQIYKWEWTQLRSQIILFVLEFWPSYDVIFCQNQNETNASITFAEAHLLFWCQKFRSSTLQTKRMCTQRYSLWHSSIWLHLMHCHCHWTGTVEQHYKLGRNVQIKVTLQLNTMRPRFREKSPQL